MTTGERIKARRKQLSISADELASRVGVSRSTVFRWEKGEIEKIPAVQMSILARVLQTTESYLFGWSDDPEPDAPQKEPAFYRAATPTFKIISSGLSELPPEEQEKILAILRAMYSNNPDLFSAKGVVLLKAARVQIPASPPNGSEMYFPGCFYAHFRHFCRGILGSSLIPPVFLLRSILKNSCLLITRLITRKPRRSGAVIIRACCIYPAAL